MSPIRHAHLMGLDGHEERPPHAKIVATLGPASDSPEQLRRLIEAGVSIFRLNFSHGSLEEQERRLHAVREVTETFGRPIGLLGDLQGPKIRVTRVPDVSPTDEGPPVGIVVSAGEDLVFRAGVDTAEPPSGDSPAVFGTTFDRIFHDVEPGQRVLINDGAIRMLAVDRVPGRELRCRVTVGGRVTSAKGINLPESDLRVPAITERDWACVEWAVRHGLDFLALSFVRTAEEVLTLKERLAGMCSVEPRWSDDAVGLQIPVISKIEKPQALVNIDEIVEASDGVMVARGDLGVEMDVAQVPVAQKHIIAKCAEWGRPCIVATQMLETMITSVSPTRAEASDVANAIFDGADGVMLSGETAIGRHPDVVVETMRRIILAAEARIDQLPHVPSPPPRLQEYPYRSAAMAHGAWYVAAGAKAKLVVVWSEAGGMATYLSQNDFRIPIVAYTSSAVAARRMALLGGVTPVCAAPPASGMLSDWTDMVEKLVLERGYGEHGDAVVLIAGKPLGDVIAQNTLAIMRLGDPASGFRGPPG